jgi:hypothetical protein
VTIGAQPKQDRIPAWAWGVLGALAAYQAAMYGWVMRTYISPSVVLLPWLLRQPGYRLHENVILPYMPGGPWIGMALYALIPGHLLRVRLAMIVVVVAIMLGVFLLARRWWGLGAGVMAAALAALWGPVIMDRPLYYEVLLGPMTLAAAAAWHRVDDRWQRPVLAGLIVGLSILIKQQAIAIALVFVIWRVLGTDQKRWPRTLADLGLFLVTAALPVGLLILAWALQGRLSGSLYWAWTYSLGQPYEARSLLEVGLREAAVVAAWLALVPLFAFFVIPQREQWRREDILLLGLLPALCLPIFPRYNRFHLSAAVPIAALIGAGALAYAFQAARERKTWLPRLLKLYGIGAAALMAVALVLPTYYRIRLGPRTGEYEALVPIAEWTSEETGAPPGTRVWLMPSIDPTDNFYAISGYLPPTFWAQTYPWFQDVPGLTDRVLDGLEADLPPYAVVIERWRGDVPDELLDYLDAYYVPIGEMQQTVDPDYGDTVTLYERVP